MRFGAKELLTEGFIRCTGRILLLAGAFLLSLQNAFAANLKWEPALRTWEKPPRAPEPEREILSALKWEGSLKGLVISSRTPHPENERYTQAVTRLRMKVSAGNEAVRLRMEHDLEWSGGSLYRRPSYLQHQAQLPPPTRWDGESTLKQSDSWRLAQRPYRATLAVRKGPADVTLGRQRIPLGLGRFYSALDVLNPHNPSQVEGEEKVGVDALKLEYTTESSSRFIGVLAPDPTRLGNSRLLRYQAHAYASDIAATVGKIRRDRLYGADVATQWKDAGVRGELVMVEPELGSRYGRVLVGVDYAFSNGMSFSVEGYASGQSMASRRATLQADPWRLYVEPQGRRYAGGELRYEPNPIFQFSSTILYNTEDRGAFWGSKAQYLPAESVVLTFGMQNFFGKADTEFGGMHFLSYLSSQWYF
ncbi:MAG TPA: hypothetical protein VM532_12555 [Burkholderiales bacterium]|nr:hypothetical protein [Burkholderiales bacterium]